MKKNSLKIFVGSLLFLTVFTSCRSLQNEGGVDWATVTFSVGNSSNINAQKHKSPSFSTSSNITRTILIAAVPATKSSITTRDYLDKQYDGLLLDLAVDTIKLSVPLNTNLRLIKVVFWGDLTLKNINEFQPVAASIGISDVFSLKGGVTKKTVGITMDSSYTAKEISGFNFVGAENSSLSRDVTGTINTNMHTINLTVPFMAHLPTLVASFNTGDAAVSVGTTEQTSGTTPNDFSSSLTYTANAPDGSTQDYTVNVSTASLEQRAYLKAPNNAATYRLGWVSGISGDTLIGGTIFETGRITSIINGNDLSTANNSGVENGAVYVFTRDDGNWSHQAYLKPSNNGDNDRFGSWAAIDGDTVVVGAYFEDSDTETIIHGSDLSGTNDGANNSGAAYVFVRNGTTWSQQAYLKPPNNTAGDEFGTAVAISGDTIVVGSRNEDSDTTAIVNGSDLSGTNDSGGNSGAAYVYVRNGTTWTLQAYLKAPNSTPADAFGADVKIAGDTIVVRAPNEDSDTTSIINDSDLSGTNDSGPDSGALYVFVRDGTNWSLQSYLKTPHLRNGGTFGLLTMSENTIVASDPGEASNTTSIIHGTDLSSTNTLGSGNGAAYVFVRDGTNWSFEAYLKAPNAGDTDNFGNKVMLCGDRLLVGAYGEDSITTAIIEDDGLVPTDNGAVNAGALYIYERKTGIWSFKAYVKGPNTAAGDQFGANSSLDGDTIVATGDRENGTTTGIIHGSDLSGANSLGSDNGALYVLY